MSNSYCKLLEDCPIYNDKLKDKEGMKKIFKRRYCEGEYKDCVRYEIADKVGKNHVPRDLLPNQHDKAEKIIKEADNS